MSFSQPFKNKKNHIILVLLIIGSDTFSCFNLAAASPYAGFIALQCPHPAHKNNHVKYHYSIPSLSYTIITDIHACLTNFIYVTTEHWGILERINWKLQWNIHDYNTYKKCYQSDFYYKNLTCKKIKNKL